MTELAANHQQILRRIPQRINDMEVLLYLQRNQVNWEYVQTLKIATQFKDELLSEWLNITTKTFRNYKKTDQEINISTKEHVLLLLSLMLHGQSVFGSIESFQTWLEEENFYFDNKSPKDYLNTITGIRFVDERLTALEYGDNV
ncbi:MAG: MbcA/ParS/Xre antitoxin family protein [Cyclobacteriaceae bacterium]